MSAIVQGRSTARAFSLTNISLPTVIHWILRIGLAACYIGHGAFGIITKASWLPYFGFAGIPESVAWKLMPIVGSADITLGLVILFYPARSLLLWAAVWTVWTALLRPFTGEGPWEFFERGGNYGVPIAMLYLATLNAAGGNLRAFITEKALPRLTVARAQVMLRILSTTTAMLLIGHGGFGLFMHKKVWFNYFAVLGIGKTTVQDLSLMSVVGAFEILLGIAVFFKPVRPLLLAIFAWKVGTELLRPLSGEPFWEFIERGGSYTAPLAAYFVARYIAQEQPKVAERPVRSARQELATSGD